MRQRLDTLATSIDIDGQRLALRDKDGTRFCLAYDELIVGTGAMPVRPPIGGLDELGIEDGSTCCTRWATRSRSPTAWTASARL